MTLRELVHMAEGRQKYSWQQMGSLMALIANINRDPKKTRAFKVSDFDPFAEKNNITTVINKENISILRTAFTGG